MIREYALALYLKQGGTLREWLDASAVWRGYQMYAAIKDQYPRALTQEQRACAAEYLSNLLGDGDP